MCETASVALWLQLVDVNGDGADAEELDAVHGEVLLGPVDDPEDDVVVVVVPFPQLGVEHPHLGQ